MPNSHRGRSAEQRQLKELLLCGSGAFAEAEALFRRAIELEPRSHVAHVSLGRALGKQDDHAGAEAAFRCALAIDPTNHSREVNLLTPIYKAGFYNSGPGGIGPEGERTHSSTSVRAT